MQEYDRPPFFKAGVPPRNGTCEPSPELVGNRALLARDPEKRIRELGENWGVADEDAA